MQLIYFVKILQKLFMQINFIMLYYTENFDSLYLLQRCYSIESVFHIFLSIMG